MRVPAASSIMRRISGGRMFGICAGVNISREETEKGGSDLALHDEEVQDLNSELDGLNDRVHVRLARLRVVRELLLPLGTRICARVSLPHRERARARGGRRACLPGGGVTIVCAWWTDPCWFAARAKAMVSAAMVTPAWPRVLLRSC
jgi:hypothetical protein